jgi:hypothetical protein
LRSFGSPSVNHMTTEMELNFPEFITYRIFGHYGVGVDFASTCGD